MVNIRSPIRILFAVVITVMALGSGLARTQFTDRPRLASETDTMVMIVDRTVTAISPGHHMVLRPNSSNAKPPISGADDRLSYDHCDYWWNLIWPGWQAGIVYQFTTNGEQDQVTIQQAVKRLWSTYGGDIKTKTDQQTIELVLSLKYSSVLLRLHRTTQQAELIGATDCLSTD